MRAPVVEVVRRRCPRPVALPTAPLPPVVLTALAAIVRDMRDVPRDCLRDPAELFHWLRRMANRVEGVGRMRAPGTTPRLVRPAGPAAARPAIPRDLDEAVFGRVSSSAVTPGTRTIVSRRGWAVRIEVRRARAAGQMEFWS